jgi:hypothetical protein
MNNLVEVVLGGEAVRHMEYCLRHGKTLAKFLLEQFDLNAGRITTFLPSNVSPQAAEDFMSGGKFPAEPPVVAITKEGERVTMQRIPNCNEHLVRIIEAFISEREGRACVFEDALAAPGDPFLSRSVAQLLVYGNEVYHLLIGRDVRTRTMSQALSQAHSIPIFIGVLTSVVDENNLVGPSPRSITAVELRAFAEGTERIIVGAYDGEGYVLWSKP